MPNMKMILSKKDGTLSVIYEGDRTEVYDVPPRTPLNKILSGEVLLTAMDDAVHACPACLGDLKHGTYCPVCGSPRRQ